MDEDCPEFNEILDLNYGDKLSGEVAEKFFSDSVKTLERKKIEEKIREYKKLASEERDTEKRKEIARKLDEYTKLLK